MSNYIIFLGGTGARCGEAFAHLTMSGQTVGNPGEALHVMIADSDDQNGNTVRAVQLFEKYISMYESLQLTGSTGNMARQKIEDVRFWQISSGLFDQKEDGTLREERLNSLNEHEDPELQRQSQMLMKALYTPSEMNNRIPAIGFFAHPNVGAAILRASILKDEDTTAATNQYANDYGELCACITNDLRSGTAVKVMLVGSLFGGTGAACIPGIAEDLAAKAADLPQATSGRLTIGTTMMLPYFLLENPPGAQVATIDSEKFRLASKTALQYYAEQKTPFEKTYLLGLPHTHTIKHTERGGARQKNKAKIIEWEAALACMSFFNAGEDGKNGVYYRGCTFDSEKLHVNWNSFSITIDPNLGQYLRFALVYKYKFKPELDEMKTGHLTKSNYYIKYYEPFIRAHNIEKANHLFNALDDSVNWFLDWILDSLKDSAVEQQVVDMDHLDHIIKNQLNGLAQKRLIRDLVKDSQRHRDFNQINTDLRYANFGEPKLPENSLGHLLQGLHSICQ